MSTFNLRMATVADAAAIGGIYAHYVEHTTVTFEYDTPSVAEMERRISATLGFYPYLVCEAGSGVIGYAYSGRHMARAAYQWNAELSVYIHKAYTGKGAGSMLYKSIIAISAMQGLRNLYGCVTTPNPASEKLHQRLGFERAGTWRESGYKFGQWRDVSWFEKRLPAPNVGSGVTAGPVPPLPVKDLAPEAIARILLQATGQH